MFFDHSTLSFPVWHKTQGQDKWWETEDICTAILTVDEPPIQTKKECHFSPILQYRTPSGKNIKQQQYVFYPWKKQKHQYLFFPMDHH